jgi:hypothetical protein
MAMKDPDYIDPESPRMPDEWRRNYQNRSVTKLPEDVAKAFDRITSLEHKLNQTFDRVKAISKEINEMHSTLLKLGKSSFIHFLWLSILSIITLFVMLMEMSR